MPPRKIVEGRTHRKAWCLKARTEYHSPLRQLLLASAYPPRLWYYSTLPPGKVWQTSCSDAADALLYPSCVHICYPDATLCSHLKVRLLPSQLLRDKRNCCAHCVCNILQFMTCLLANVYWHVLKAANVSAPHTACSQNEHCWKLHPFLPPRLFLGLWF